ncbi:MAG: FHA domain-containing protein [Actinobacteria bacterium]|nr:FHA domain-containing protein [Actinomycetota bacterium]
MEKEKNKNNKTDSIKIEEIELVKELPQDIIDHLKKIPKNKSGIIIIKGPNIGDKFYLTKDKFSIGRSSDSDILLDDITVSRQHAIIEKNNEEFILRDLGSLNGTYINGKIINEAKLNNGDKLQIGKYIFLFFSTI